MNIQNAGLKHQLTRSRETFGKQFKNKRKTPC